MTAGIAATALGIANSIGTHLDVFFSGVWWWRLRRWRAEEHLERVLARDGEKSMEARSATERFRGLEFAVTFWRPAPRPVQQVIRDAAASGVPIEALRLVALSQDLKNQRFCHCASAFTAALCTVGRDGNHCAGGVGRTVCCHAPSAWTRRAEMFRTRGRHRHELGDVAWLEPMVWPPRASRQAVGSSTGTVLQKREACHVDTAEPRQAKRLTRPQRLPVTPQLLRPSKPPALEARHPSQQVRKGPPSHAA